MSDDAQAMYCLLQFTPGAIWYPAKTPGMPLVYKAIQLYIYIYTYEYIYIYIYMNNIYTYTIHYHYRCPSCKATLAVINQL